jgi:hypothetical protein
MIRKLRNASVEFLLGAVLVSAGLAACASSEETTSTLDTGVVADCGTGALDSSASADTSTDLMDTGLSDTSTAGDDSGQSDAAGDAYCAMISSLHPPPPDAGMNTIYCPFSGGGPSEYCTAGTQHCCQPTGPSTVPASCLAIGTPCPSSGTGVDVDWQCEDPIADCPGGMVCCAMGATLVLGAPGCGNSATHMTGTVCASPGACTGIVMCTTPKECPAGQNCNPFVRAGNAVGGCK